MFVATYHDLLTIELDILSPEIKERIAGIFVSLERNIPVRVVGKLAVDQLGTLVTVEQRFHLLHIVYIATALYSLHYTFFLTHTKILYT
jgi:hypothetical protein